MSEINRQLSNKTAISYRNQLSKKGLRSARARTLIQAGGLLSLTGFLSFCGIEEGQDLQIDIESRDKAAMLLGILSEAFDQLTIEPSKVQFEHWKSTGVRIMKMRK